MSHSRLMSGDDVLFVNVNAQKRRVAVSYNPESFTTCESKETFHQWNTQKQRHFSASERYKGSHKFMLAMEPMARSYFYLAAVALSFFGPLYLLTGTLFLLRYMVFMYTICKTANKFKINGVKALALLFDIILPYINLAQMILGNIRKERLKWK